MGERRTVVDVTVTVYSLGQRRGEMPSVSSVTHYQHEGDAEAALAALRPALDAAGFTEGHDADAGPASPLR